MGAGLGHSLLAYKSALQGISKLQITEALAGVGKKGVMKKQPKFIYNEEKALEKTRKTLKEKIAQLKSAIDEASGQYHSGDSY